MWAMFGSIGETATGATCPSSGSRVFRRSSRRNRASFGPLSTLAIDSRFSWGRRLDGSRRQACLIASVLASNQRPGTRKRFSISAATECDILSVQNAKAAPTRSCPSRFTSRSATIRWTDWGGRRTLSVLLCMRNDIANRMGLRRIQRHAPTASGNNCSGDREGQSCSAESRLKPVPRFKTAKPAIEAGR